MRKPTYFLFVILTFLNIYTLENNLLLYKTLFTSIITLHFSKRLIRVRNDYNIIKNIAIKVAIVMFIDYGIVFMLY